MAKYIIKIVEDSIHDALNKEIKATICEKLKDIKHDKEETTSTIKA